MYSTNHASSNKDLLLHTPGLVWLQGDCSKCPSEQLSWHSYRKKKKLYISLDRQLYVDFTVEQLRHVKRPLRGKLTVFVCFFVCVLTLSFQIIKKLINLRVIR